MVKVNWKCFDCKKTTDNDKDYYMVHNTLWNKYGVGHYMLCIDCLTKRVGRTLVYEDFTDCALNEWNPYVQSLKKENDNNQQ